MFENFGYSALVVVAFVICANCVHGSDISSWQGKAVFLKEDNLHSYKTADASERNGPSLYPSVNIVTKQANGRIGFQVEGSILWFNKSDVVELADAEKYFTSAIQHDQNNKYAITCRAGSYMELGEHAKALADLKTLIRLDPMDAMGYFHTGYFYTFIKPNLDKALTNYNEAIRLNPEHTPSVKFRCELFFANGECEKALADANEVIRQNPRDFFGFYLRGSIKAAMKKEGLGIDDLTEAIRLDEKDPRSFYNRGASWKLKNEFQQALADFESAVRLDPENPDYHLNLAWHLATCPDAKFRNGSRALDAAKTGCKLSAWKRPEALDVLAAAYAETNQFAEAVKWQQKAIDLSKKTKQDNLLQKQIKRRNLYKNNQQYHEDSN